MAAVCSMCTRGRYPSPSTKLTPALFYTRLKAVIICWG